ncbi:MAG: M20/M25/M40 family metallo-hydrolase [Desulfobulbaceae bacterium]|nr:M20/M25/M40 family metallo-hydrolase [Desulfobulbaceae bacterium]
MKKKLGPFKLALHPWEIPQWLWALALVFLLGLVLWAGLLAVTWMPGSSFIGQLPPLTADERFSASMLQKHTVVLSQDIGPRNIWRPDSMSSTVHYLEKVLHDLGYSVQQQKFDSYGVPTVNLEVEIPGKLQAGEIIVIGAHYDTVEGSPGANDNGSGVAALLEIARLLIDARPQHTIRLVFFANEEPPFYYSWDMGSRHYAHRSHNMGEKIVAMLSLETIGCYKFDPGSQRYPFPFFLFYPNTADFIAFVGNFQSRQLVRRLTAVFRQHTLLPSEGIAAPGFITGIGWSDHWSFWKEGYSALMVTDTAFFRSKEYHTPEDTAEKLDYERMARLLNGLTATIRVLAR